MKAGAIVEQASGLHGAPAAAVILRGARVARSARRAEKADVAVARGRIRHIGRVAGRKGLDLSDCLILPGLINAHDHLDFSVFPRLGDGPYETCGHWARDIRARFADAIDQVRSIAREERLIWGGIRNLACGVTTVCHHNPSHSVFARGFPVRVMRRFSWAHSLEFSPELARSHAACPSTRPFIFHAGEAVNGAGRREMVTLARLGLFAPNSVLVHAVALDRDFLSLARQNGCALVWCPSSNMFILGRTLTREVLNSGLPVALGTDSGISAEGDMLDELRFAQAISGLTEARLYGMVTSGAASVLRLADGEGSLSAGALADFVVFRDAGQSPCEALFRQLPEAVFIGGRLQLASEEFAARTPEAEDFTPLSIQGRGRVRVRCRIPAMRPGIRLAGREVTV
ncbi:MAG TPA: amidohydrolase family protein [Bryobacteraceae bacterium]|nr:amidohydrolase family protein [Bryobacteraceae bacterium]